MLTFPQVLRQWRSLITTNLVIAEAYALIRYRVSYTAAMQFLEGLDTQVQLERVYSSVALEREAAAILRRYTDQKFSYVDAVSFALMRRRNINIAFAFDRHFWTAGFSLLPVAAPER
jgi:predicted nucleic acid-binding protein